MLSFSPARAVLVAVLVAASCLLPAAAAVAGDDDGVGIDVIVLGPPAPTPTPTTPRGSGSGGSGSGGGSTPEVTATPVEPGPKEDEGVDLGGILYVGGLEGDIVPNVGPTGGTANLSIALRNTSDYLMQVELRFWLQNAFGATVAEVKDVVAADLLPGETRTVRVQLNTVGQWAVYYGHVTVTPPEVVDGTKLSSITRDATLMVPPFFILLTGGFAALLYAAIRYLRVRRVFAVGLPA